MTNAKAAQMAASTLKGNNTGATANASDLTAAQVKTLLAIASTDVSGLAAIATSGSASNLIAGTVPAAQMPAHTGDVTSTAGSVATAIAANAVTNAKAAQMAASTIKGNNTGATANASDLTVAQVKTLLAIASTDVSGLAAIATSGSASNLIAGTIPAAQMPAHTGDVTSTAGSVATAIAANAVTNAKAAQMASHTFKGNNTGATANALDLTATQLTAELDVFASALKGLVPASGGGTVNFLRADGTFSPPPGAGGGEANTASNAGAGGVGVFKAKSGLDLQFKNINAGSAALTITDDTANSEIDINIAVNGVPNTLLAQMAASTIKGNNTGATANASDLTAAQVKTLLAIASTDVSGLAAIATSGSASNLIAGTIPTAQMPAFTGDVTSTAGSVAMAIAANAVTNAKAAQMAASTIKGNNTGATANASDLTGAQVQALLVAQPSVQTFTASGTWTKPAGCKRVRVRAVGGGGGATAAASQAACGAGGASGAYGEDVYDVTSTATVAVTVGASGAGGAAANGTGGAGGNRVSARW